MCSSDLLPGFLELCQPEDASLWLGELASAERRLIMIHTLASSFPVDVWGDSGWQRAPAARYRGPATHRVQAAKVYAGATINLDIGRLYQMDIMTMRVPDVLASGGFLIAERSETLAELFREGEHLEAWASVEELHQKVSYYLKNPQKAREIALQGQAHVRAHHSIRARLEQMLFDIPLKIGRAHV